jgi:DNA-binding NarL/FixJ family response regulator
MLTLLVVEDSVIFRQMLVESLKREFPDLEILEAAEGKEALRLVEEAHPILVFMDIKLPGESGLDLTKEIKHHPPETTVVILTSNDLREYREAAQKAGATQFIAKGSASFQDILRAAHTILSKGGDGNPTNRRDGNVPRATART